MTDTDIAGGSLLRRRLRSQQLSGPPARSVPEAVARLLAVQAQDARGARLAIRSRSTGLSASDVDRALTQDRSVVVSTLNRGTLHMVLAEDYWWMHELTTPQLRTSSVRRLAQEGVSADDADRAAAIIEEQLGAHGPMTRAQLREPIAAAGIRVEGQAMVHVLLHAVLNGTIVRGPMIGAQHAFALVREWLGPPPRSLERPAALSELARRYLAGHGPADAADLARWAGITVGDARRAFAGAAGSLSLRADGLAELSRPADGSRRTPAADPPFPPPRLLGAFDPSLLGWVSRAPIVGAHQGIVTSNGLFRPFAMVDGRAVAIWGLSGMTSAATPTSPRAPKVTITPLEAIGADARAALDADADAVVTYLLS